jgi:hypothetical protein
MKMPHIAFAAILFALASAMAIAAPPAAVGDSLLVMSAGIEYITTSVYYLGADGTALLLSSGGWGPGPVNPAYIPSAKGTFTFQPAQGNPNQATLTIVIATNGQISSSSTNLIFTSDTRGYYVYQGFGSFTFFLPSGDVSLLNVSNRVTLRKNDTAVSGFVIGGTAPRFVLIRAVGQSLASFGVSPVSVAPQFAVYSSASSQLVASGQAWNVSDANVFGPYEYDAQAMGWTFELAGAFPLASGSNEQAFFNFLQPGAYTVQTTDPAAASTGGSELTEVYVLPYSG